MTNEVWDNSRKACGGLLEPLSGFRPFSMATQGRTVREQRQDGSTLGWIVESLQDWRLFPAGRGRRKQTLKLGKQSPPVPLETVE